IKFSTFSWSPPSFRFPSTCMTRNFLSAILFTDVLPRIFRLNHPTIILIAAIGLLALPLSAQQPITGVVTESGSGQPVSGVRVTLDDGSASDVTGTTGAYHLILPAGRSAVTI